MQFMKTSVKVVGWVVFFFFLIVVVGFSFLREGDRSGSQSEKRKVVELDETADHQKKSKSLSSSSNLEESLDSHLERLSSIKDKKIRFESLRDLLNDPPKEATLLELMELARSQSGIGTNRLLLFSDVFSNSENFTAEEVVAIYRELTLGEERSGANMGMGIAQVFRIDNIESLNLSFKEEGLGTALTTSLLDDMGIGYDLDKAQRLDETKGRQTLNVMETLLNEGKIEQKNILEVLQRIQLYDSSIVFDFFKDSSNDLSSPEMTKMMAANVRATVAERPEESLTYFLDEGGERFGRFVNSAYKEWLKVDPDSADLWYKENYNSLPKEQLDLIKQGTVERSIEAGEFDTAKEWIETISDIGIKNAVRREIEKAERRRK